MHILIFFLFSVCFWAVLLHCFQKDRSRYRNCYLLFLALLSMIPFILSLFGDNMGSAVFAVFITVSVALFIVPFFLIHNGIIMLEVFHGVHAGSVVLSIRLVRCRQPDQRDGHLRIDDVSHIYDLHAVFADHPQKE